MGSDVKTLLILAGGVEAVSGILTARERHLHVVVADGDINAPGKKYADDFIHVNIYNSDETLIAVKEYTSKNKIDGVITIAADNPLSVSKVANHLNLEAPSVRVSSICSDKVHMKDVFRMNNVPIPWYKGVRLKSEIIEVLRTRPGEYVLKPADSRGSRGVIRLSDISKCGDAWEFSRNYSTSGQLIIEEWLEGDQLSSESIVWEGASHLAGLADRNYNRLDELHPFIVEDGGETPSKYSPNINDDIDTLMTDAAKAIGLKNGVIKGDIVLTDNGPYVIEVAPRLSGGYFSTDTIPLVYGYSIINQLISIALGEMPTLPLSPLKVNSYQANRFIFLKPGKIESIEHQNIFDEEIVFNQLSVNVGDMILQVDNHTKRAGMVMAVSDSSKSAIEKCEREINRIKIKLSSP
jgi:biotin carboxylase